MEHPVWSDLLKSEPIRIETWRVWAQAAAGTVKVQDVIDWANRLVDLGCEEPAVFDATGLGDVDQAAASVTALRALASVGIGGQGDDVRETVIAMLRDPASDVDLIYDFVVEFWRQARTPEWPEGAVGDVMELAWWIDVEEFATPFNPEFYLRGKRGWAIAFLEDEVVRKALQQPWWNGSLRELVTDVGKEIGLLIREKVGSGYTYEVGPYDLDPRRLIYWVVTDTDVNRDVIAEDRPLQTRFRDALKAACYPVEAIAEVRFVFQSQETIDREYRGEWDRAIMLERR